MRRFCFFGITMLVLCILPLNIMAEDLLTQADALYDNDQFKEAADLYAKASDADPAGYDAAWKASRAYRGYCNSSKEDGVQGWEDICRQYGKVGMNYGEKAVKIAPDKVEGNFWYACCVGCYSDGVSIVTALKEGLKDKTQTSFEKSYSLNKMYCDGGPIKGLGRFWHVLPWPLRDKDKALNLLTEYNQAFPDEVEGQVYLAETLLTAKPDGYKEKAKSLLKKASASDRTYYSSQAKKLLEKKF